MNIDFNKIQKISDKVKEYELAYFNEIRKYIAKFAFMVDAFPPDFNTGKRICCYANLEGLLVIRWPAEIDSFEFSFTTRPMSQIMSDQPELQFTITSEIVDGLDFDVDAIELRNKDGAMVSKPKWFNVTITTNGSNKRWSEDKARANARGLILSLVTAHLMDIKKKPSEISNTIIQNLETKIEEFKVLLNSNPREEDIQQFLAQNPVILEPTAQEITPKIQLGSEFITDFVIRVSTNQYILVEIEQSGHEMFTRNGDPTSKLSHAQRQVQNWRNWVQENTSYARNSMPEIIDPECWVIMGRRGTMTLKDTQLLSQMNRDLNKITIKTYDDIVDRASRYLKNLRDLSKR